MIAYLARFSIRNAGIVAFAALLLVCYGSYRFTHAGLDIFPEFSPKQVVIQTEAPGFSAEHVETIVTQPIEAALSGLIGIDTLHSESIQGLSIVTAIFHADTEIYHNRQLVSERLASLATQFPTGIDTPVAVPLSSSSATVRTIGLTSDSKDLMQLRSLVDWTLVPHLMAVPGVADINVFGGEIKQLQLQINPQQLYRYNVSVDEIIAAAATAGNIQGGGFLENSNQRFTIQLSGQATNPEQLGKIIIKRHQGQHITLTDVSDIGFAPEPPIGMAQVMGKPGIVMMIIGQYGANTLTVSKEVERALAQFEHRFQAQGINFYPDLFRPADYIETSLTNLSSHLLLGGLFVLLILYAFLYNLRSALISAVAIPVSLVSAVIVLLETGNQLNIMVLGGLAIALGEVVDDAIIDTENIFRRLRENRLLPHPLPVKEVVFAASMEVRSSVVYASFIVALVFVPLLTLGGVAGRLFAPLGYAYILAILMSLLVALTLTPALCYLLLNKVDLLHREPPLINWLKPSYNKLLCIVNRHFKAVMSASLLACVWGGYTLLHFEGKFLPELREGHYMVHTTSIPGTSLQESIRTGSQLTQLFLDIPGVVSVSQWAGRAERGADTYGSHYSEFEVRLEKMSGSQQQQVLDHLKEILSEFPGILYEANTFLIERVDETISGYTADVVVNIFGNDLAELDRLAGKTAAIIRTIAGAENVQLRAIPGTPLLDINLDMDQLAFYGVQPEQVINTVKAAYEGRIIGKNFEGNKHVNIAVTLAPELKQQPENLGLLPIRSLDGNLIPLHRVARISETTARYNILHEHAQRKQTITSNIDTPDIARFVQELETRIHNEMSLDADSYIELTGAAIEQSHAKEQLLIDSLMAATGVLLFIYIAIGSLRHMLLTLANVPFSLLGGIAAVVVTGSTLSVGSMVGFVTLFGITVRNSIMLTSHYQYLTTHEGQQWNLQTAFRGAQERLPSILMTALVTALAMAPIAFNSDNPGREIMGPMAAIIIGGLASSTLLNLLLLPAILLRYGDFEER